MRDTASPPGRFATSSLSRSSAWAVCSRRLPCSSSWLALVAARWRRRRPQAHPGRVERPFRRAEIRASFRLAAAALQPAAGRGYRHGQGRCNAAPAARTVCCAAREAVEHADETSGCCQSLAAMSVTRTCCSPSAWAIRRPASWRMAATLSNSSSAARAVPWQWRAGRHRRVRPRRCPAKIAVEHSRRGAAGLRKRRGSATVRQLPGQSPAIQRCRAPARHCRSGPKKLFRSTFAFGMVVADEGRLPQLHRMQSRRLAAVALKDQQPAVVEACITVRKHRRAEALSIRLL